jgi:hypothetical protein
MFWQRSSIEPDIKMHLCHKSLSGYSHVNTLHALAGLTANNMGIRGWFCCSAIAEQATEDLCNLRWHLRTRFAGVTVNNPWLLLFFVPAGHGILLAL